MRTANEQPTVVISTAQYVVHLMVNSDFSHWEIGLIMVDGKLLVNDG